MPHGVGLGNSRAPGVHAQPQLRGLEELSTFCVIAQIRKLKPREAMCYVWDHTWFLLTQC